MNHDATHCADYLVAKCSKRCYRAQLTQDLRERPNLHFVPISWANFNVYAIFTACHHKASSAKNFLIPVVQDFSSKNEPLQMLPK